MVGKFIVIEGINGAGKSRAAELLNNYYVSQKLAPVLLVREPGGSVLGEKIREFIKFGHNESNEKIHPISQTALFLAARIQLYYQLIRPALDKGTVVVSDRWITSTLVYQGITQRDGLPPADILNISDIMLQGFRPDATIILDLPVEVSLERRKRMEDERVDRFEKEGIQFQQSLRDAYKLIATSFPRHRLVDADGSIMDVHHRIVTAIKDIEKKGDLD